jgi:two-component system, OmpR family, osmolarity sensor histidine kinase EnvZ
MMRWPSSLLGRNVLVLVASLLIFQLLFLAVLLRFVLLPQSERIATVVADSIAAMSTAMDALPPECRAALIADLDATEFLDIVPEAEDPPIVDARPRILERVFMRKLLESLEGQDELSWRMGNGGVLWIHIKIGPDYYWIASHAPRSSEPLLVSSISFLILTVIVGLFGTALSSQVARPLRDLQKAADSVALGRRTEALEIVNPAEIGALARSFNRMTERLAEAEQERALVLAGVSHDLRTPMAKLRLAVELLPAEDPETKVTIERQVNRMDRLLRQFLDYARGFDAEARQPRHLAQCVREAAHEAGHPVALDIPDTVEAMVRPGALQRALVNLIENAAAHGAPPVSAQYRREPGWHVLAIRDSGAGAPPDVLEALKQPFRRGEGTAGVSGSGLGLAIVDRIAGAHGGRLELSSPASGGFEAAIWLPA